MNDKKSLLAILNSVREPILVADTNHIVRFMNNAAMEHYSEGEKLLGTDLLDCHNEESREMMVEILAEMRNGLDEKIITDKEEQKIFMRAVSDDDGNLLGYFERYEPFIEKDKMMKE